MAWAQNESPYNLERVCKLAEVHSEMGHEKEAQENLDLAEKIDSTAPLTQETTARVALNSGDTSKVKSVLEKYGKTEKNVSNDPHLPNADKKMVNFVKHESHSQ